MQVVLDEVLPADPRSVAAARRLVRQAVGASTLTERADDAALAVSELATNAVVHVGAAFGVKVLSSGGALRVEIHDASPHLPTARSFGQTAMTGRGLRIVADCADRWGAEASGDGKTVWIEFGTATGTDLSSAADGGTSAGSHLASPTLTVSLLDVPLLMHLAWQEHAQALLREYLLNRMTEDDGLLEQHAVTSETLSLLYEQIPRPRLPDDPDALLADALEPDVTARELSLSIPLPLVAGFATLSLLLGRAVDASRTGSFLAPPTQPEVEEMREWLCQEVLRQATGDGEPRPWRTRTDVRTLLADPADQTRRYAALLEGVGDVIVTDEASVIVAVSPSVARFLGYAGPEDLLGRRIIVVVPERYHQAHIAGTTLNAVNGRDTLLGVRIEVPMVRADGTEVPVALTVRPHQLGATRVFVADLALPSS